VGANIKLERLSDVTRRGWNLGVQCECGHVAIVDAQRMERWYMCHRWDTRWHLLRDHLYCLSCRRCPAPVRLRPSAQQPTAPNRFPRTEEQWARLVKGLRD
jgi:hypothetical protein